MQIFTDDGLVLKAGVTGEADMILHVLTRSHGIIRTFAKGARGAKSRLHAVSTPFSFADFTFSEKNGVYNVREAQIKPSSSVSGRIWRCSLSGSIFVRSSSALCRRIPKATNICV